LELVRRSSSSATPFADIHFFEPALCSHPSTTAQQWTADFLFLVTRPSANE